MTKFRAGFMAAFTVVAGIALAACSGSDEPATPPAPQPVTAVAPQSTAPSSTASSNAAPAPGGKTPGASTPHKPAPPAKPAGGVPHQAGVKCTDQVDYAGDPRPNVEINSEGESTGHCPAPKAGDKPPAGTPHQAGMKCTDQVDYAGDPRPNVEINSEGESTGVCPAPKH